jgi:uncharacterized membrane protein YdjX (TVP38/TMEM64 family)
VKEPSARNAPAKHTAQEDPTLIRRRKAIGIASIAVIVVVVLALGWLLGKPVMELVQNRDSFRAWMDSRGSLKYIIMAGLMVLQILIAVIPGGPMVIAAGYAFGPFLGTFLCVLGSVLGTWGIFLLTRRYGMRLVSLFVNDKQMENMELLKDKRRLHVVLFLLFLIPGMPKDIITYLGGLLPMSLASFLIITTVARTPAIFVSALGGHWIGKEAYGPAAFVLAVALLVTLAGWAWMRRHEKNKAAKPQDGDQSDV